MYTVSSHYKKLKMQGLVTFLKGLNVYASLIEKPATEEQPRGYWEVAVSDETRDIAKHLYGAWLDRVAAADNRAQRGVTRG